MTLNGVIDGVISPNSVAFRTDYVEVVKDTPNTLCGGIVAQRI